MFGVKLIRKLIAEMQSRGLWIAPEDKPKPQVDRAAEASHKDFYGEHQTPGHAHTRTRLNQAAGSLFLAASNDRKKKRGTLA